jgi:hypothetical protein
MFVFTGVPDNYIEKYINRYDNNQDFFKLYHILNKNNEFKKVCASINISEMVITMLYLMKPVTVGNFDLKQVQLKQKTLQEPPKPQKLFNNLFKLKLYNELENSKYISPYIAYKINKDAKKFADLFDIQLSEYVQENKKTNSCFLNIIVNTYYDQIKSFKKSNGVNKYKLISYESVKELLNIDKNMNSDIGISIEESLPFFKKYKFGLDVMSVYGEIVYRFRPEKMNKDIFPSVLRLVIYNNHVYHINSDIHKFSSIDMKGDVSEINALTVSSRYNFNDVEKVVKTKYAKDLSDITEII